MGLFTAGVGCSPCGCCQLPPPLAGTICVVTSLPAFSCGRHPHRPRLAWYCQGTPATQSPRRAAHLAQRGEVDRFGHKDLWPRGHATPLRTPRAYRRSAPRRSRGRTLQPGLALAVLPGSSGGRSEGAHLGGAQRHQAAAVARALRGGRPARLLGQQPRLHAATSVVLLVPLAGHFPLAGARCGHIERTPAQVRATTSTCGSSTPGKQRPSKRSGAVLPCLR